MPNYQLRLTCSVDNPETAALVFPQLSELAAWGACTSWLLYQHPADKEVSRDHIHVYYFDWGLKEKSFRDYFARCFPDVAKTDFAISTTAGRSKGEITLEYAIKYASENGTRNAKIVRGFDAERIKNIEDSFKTQEVPVKVQEPRQMTKWKLVEICLEEKKQEEKVYGYKLSKSQTVDLVVDVLLTYKQVFSTHKVIEICETMAAQTGDDYGSRQFIINSLRY